MFAWPAFAEDQRGKDTRFSFQYGGRERSWIVHQPPSYSPGKSWPVVLVFHGGGGSGEQIAGMTGFSLKSDKEGFAYNYTEPLPCHVEHVHAGLALRGFQELPRQAVDVEDIAALADDDRRD